MNKSWLRDDEREHHSPRPTSERGRGECTIRSASVPNSDTVAKKKSIMRIAVSPPFRCVWLLVGCARAFSGWGGGGGAREGRERVNHYDVVLTFHSVLH